MEGEREKSDTMVEKRLLGCRVRRPHGDEMQSRRPRQVDEKRPSRDDLEVSNQLDL